MGGEVEKKEEGWRKSEKERDVQPVCTVYVYTGAVREARKRQRKKDRPEEGEREQSVVGPTKSSDTGVSQNGKKKKEKEKRKRTEKRKKNRAREEVGRRASRVLGGKERKKKRRKVRSTCILFVTRLPEARSERGLPRRCGRSNGGRFRQLSH